MSFSTFTDKETSIFEFFQNHRAKFAEHPWFTIEPVSTYTDINLGTNLATVYLNISVAETPDSRVEGYVQFQWARESDTHRTSKDDEIDWAVVQHFRSDGKLKTGAKGRAMIEQS
ncbi:hypothetical protein PRZ48_010331 [Zasmidium cellare]|uniref:Uncharacterized protein n=1 Tax=Zasmidium cellare TaxID=395010 RepID=A0ABR0E8S1_ZASCE|nr:hypothetical protein PRZ48_010331 [Zasmidium cellare]